MSDRITDASPDIADPNLYRIEITRPNGSAYVAELPAEYADGRTRMARFGKGVVVVHPTQPPVYINGTTGQISHDPEICRSNLILNPTGNALGQDTKDLTHAFRRIGRH